MSPVLVLGIALLTLLLFGALAQIIVLLNNLDTERGTAELTEADRNLLRQHIRVLEENTKSNKRGRP